MGSEKVVRVEARGHVKVPPPQLWPLLADTPRLNRAIGLPDVHYRTRPRPDGGSEVIVEYRLGPFVYNRWTEHPFEWEEPRHYAVRRDLHWGPIRGAYGGVKLEPDGDGTDLLVFAELEPRNPLGALLARHLVGPRLTRTVLDQCRHFERYYAGLAATPFPQLAPRGDAAPSDRLGTLCAALVAEGADAKLVERLREHILHAPDEAVVKMRPFELADAWGADRRDVLVLCLRATVLGLLVMTWDVLCPNCRIGKTQYRSLRELRAAAHCDGCNVTFDARFSTLIEVRFSPAPALRSAPDRTFCIGGPMNTPHVVAQAPLPPGAGHTLHLDLEPGHYSLRAAGMRRAMPVEVVESEASATAGELAATLRADGAEPGHAALPAGPLRLNLVNACSRELTAVLERTVWPDTVTTAAYISTLAEFRDLFSAEVLAPGLEVSVENLAFLFTDLTGSTALYQRVGQARAFRLVQDHFVVLDTAIREHDGAIVKTIGDAVMAVFPSGRQALAAGLAIQRAIRELACGDAADPARLVKVGIHQGACLAVTLNERLDYFGTTVNVASRIEHESRGGEVVVSAAALREPGTAELIAGARCWQEPLEVSLKGIREPVRLVRLVPMATP